MEEMQQILQYFPRSVKEQIENRINKQLAQYVEEIRIRNNKPIVLKIAQEHMIINYTIQKVEIEEIFHRICENSIYSYQKQISEGFITIRGGHRIGITGSAVIENEKVINLNYISSLNIRIAREKKESSKEIINEIINIKENTIYNTLIISPPGGGKTTLLRDIIRKISNGIQEINFTPKVVGVVDERGEIAAMYKGVPQNDIGIMTDVINNIGKAKGLKLLIRSMAPQVLTCDEIGSTEDVEAIKIAMCSGIKGIFTAHGGNIEEIKKNQEIKTLIEQEMIERIIILDKIQKGRIEKIYKFTKNEIQ